MRVDRLGASQRKVPSQRFGQEVKRRPYVARRRERATKVCRPQPGHKGMSVNQNSSQSSHEQYGRPMLPPLLTTRTSASAPHPGHHSTAFVLSFMSPGNKH